MPDTEILIRETHSASRGEGCNDCEDGKKQRWVSVRDFMATHEREVGKAAERAATNKAARA